MPPFTLILSVLRVNIIIELSIMSMTNCRVIHTSKSILMPDPKN